MPAIKITVDTKEVRELFARLQGLLRRPEAVLEDLANRLLELARTAFEREASPEGVPWAPLSPSYSFQKAIGKFSAQGKLRRTGALLRTLHAGVEGGRLAFVSTAPLPYAAIHQFGGTTRAHEILPRKPGGVLAFQAGGVLIAGRPRFARRVEHPGSRIPARPYLPSAETAERIAVETLEEALEEATGEKGAQP